MTKLNKAIQRDLNRIKNKLWQTSSGGMTKKERKLLELKKKIEKEYIKLENQL